MQSIISEWIEKDVSVVLLNSHWTGGPQKGKLIGVDSLGLLLEVAKGRAFVPFTSVVQISVKE